MWGISNGTVENVFFDGKGARIKESFTKRDGTEGATYVTAFFEEPHGLQIGDAGKFQGAISVKAEQSPTNQNWYAKVVINQARVDDLVQGEGAPLDDESPF